MIEAYPNKRNTIIKNLFVLIITIYVNFTFVYKHYPIIQYLCFYGIMGIYIFFHIKKVIWWSKLVFRNSLISILSLILWGGVLFNSILFPIVHQTYDFSYINVILSIIRNIMQQLFLLILIDNILSPQCLLEEHMRININSGLLYVLISAIMIRFPILKEIWRKIIHISSFDLGKTYEKNYFTRFGLVGFSGFNETIFCSILISFSLFLLCKTIYEGKKRISYYYIAITILLLGNTFYGRSGMMISIFCIVVTLCFLFFKYGKVNIIINLCIVFSLLFLIVLLGKNHSTQLNIYYNWALKPITNFFESGKIGTASSDAMFQNMYFLPDIFTIILGSGNYVDPITGGYYMSTDIGYMRPLLFYGIINQIFAYFICIFLMIGTMKNLKTKYKSAAILFGFLSFMILLLFELKGEVFYRISGVYFALLFGAVVDKNKQSLQYRS